MSMQELTINLPNNPHLQGMSHHHHHHHQTYDPVHAVYDWYLHRRDYRYAAITYYTLYPWQGIELELMYLERAKG